MPAYALWPATARARAASAPKPLDAPVMTITLLTKLPPLLTCDVWGLPMLPAGQFSWGLVRGHHGFVELLEECAVLFRAILFSKSQRLDALNDGLCYAILRRNDGHGLVDEIIERHGALIGRLASSHQSGAHIRRDDFDHLQFGGLELVAQRLAVGMDGCLSGAIGWHDGHRQECESGGDGEDCTVPLF